MILESHKQWLRHLGLPSIALMVIVALWGGAVGIILYRMLGVRLSTVNLRPATFGDEILLYGLDGATLATFLNCLLLIVLFVGRIAYRWWIIAILLLLSTPIALYAGARFARYLWAVNQGGTPWEGFGPQVLGLTLAWLLHVPMAFILSRYRFVVVKRDDSRRSPCPRCGYELYGSGGVCPECGWQVPIGAPGFDRADRGGHSK